LHIPISDFNAELSNIAHLGILRNFDAAAYDIGISEFRVTGSVNPTNDVIFFDANHTNNVYNTPSGFTIEVLQFTYLKEIFCTELFYNTLNQTTTLGCKLGYVNEWTMQVEPGVYDVFGRVQLYDGTEIFTDTIRINLMNQEEKILFAISAGNWYNPNIWSRTRSGISSNEIPQAEDVVVIDGYNVILLDDAECSGIILSNDDGNTTLIVESANLSVFGNIEFRNVNESFQNCEFKVKNNGAVHLMSSQPNVQP
jgi:hypothetical protein